MKAFVEGYAVLSPFINDNNAEPSEWERKETFQERKKWRKIRPKSGISIMHIQYANEYNCNLRAITSRKWNLFAPRIWFRFYSLLEWRQRLKNMFRSHDNHKVQKLIAQFGTMFFEFSQIIVMRYLELVDRFWNKIFQPEETMINGIFNTGKRKKRQSN